MRGKHRRWMGDGKSRSVAVASLKTIDVIHRNLEERLLADGRVVIRTNL